jgi:hypothetical protein
MPIWNGRAILCNNTTKIAVVKDDALSIKPE